MNEFDLIHRYFFRPTSESDLVLGIGDDAAIIAPVANHHILVSTDMLVEGRHFFTDTDAYAVGHKALAVNLSDMAAMGAKPRWVFLSLALPQADSMWLSRFSEGFLALATRYGVSLVGGDTTCGPLTVSVTILGEVPAGRALRRDGAKEGEDIWVSGLLGMAALAVQYRLGDLVLAVPADILSECHDKLDFPEARIELGIKLRTLASAMVDVSDGLLADLGHIVQASRVGAIIDVDKLPTHPWLASQRTQLIETLLTGGDDYELCFTAPRQYRDAIASLAHTAACPLTRIGHIVAKKGIKLLTQGNEIFMRRKGFDHFHH